MDRNANLAKLDSLERRYSALLLELNDVRNQITLLRAEYPTKIVLNGRELLATGRTISYEQIVEMAKTGFPLEVAHTVTFQHRVHFNRLPGERNGSLTPGKTVPVSAGMVINALVTGAA